MWKIPFGDLKVTKKIRQNIKKVLDSNWISGGPFIDELEGLWSKQFGYKHSLAMSSGTDANIQMMLALYDFGIQRGDEVICPALGFVAIANSILAAGLIPKFVDIDRNTLNVDVSKIEVAITSKTKAILVVHTMGKPCNMKSIMKIAHAYNLYVLEDCCEAPGARYDDQIVGSFGSAGSFSFYVAHLISTGEGGMVSTNDDLFAKVLKSTRTHGRKDGDIYFDFERIGLNSKMNDLEAAVGVALMQDFDQIFLKRKNNIKTLLSFLEDLTPYIFLYLEAENECICPHGFPLIVYDNRCADLYRFLISKKIQCKTLFGSLPTQHKAFHFLKYKYGDFPESEYVGNHGIHFGIHQYLSTEDLFFISNTIHEFFMT